MTSSGRHPDNVAGDWFVDRRCIGCGTSYSAAPDLFDYSPDGIFVVIRQPVEADELERMRLAAELCPTRSVRSESRQHWTPRHPMLVAEGVWRLGHTSADAVGAVAYLVIRPEGNLLVDGPRWNTRLANRITELGGMDRVLITHRDDVGDAARYAEYFGARVWIHADDAEAAPFATDHWTGVDPAPVAPGVTAIPTPGHTAGHVMLLVDDMLFTGDSLAWDPTTETLGAEESVCWYSWPQQRASLRALRAHSFTRVLPAHGAPSPALSADRMHDLLTALVDALDAESSHAP